MLRREADGQLDEGNVLWRVVNPARRNARGYNTGYLVESHASAEPLLKKQDYRRAGFIGHNLWVTAYDPDERYATYDDLIMALTASRSQLLVQKFRNQESTGGVHSGRSWWRR